jgi:serine/threonine-protein kinase RsbW
MSDGGFELTLPATAENVMVVRQAIAGLGEALGLPAQRIADLKTVVTEACNNVVLHAYDEETGPLHVSAEPASRSAAVRATEAARRFTSPMRRRSSATTGSRLRSPRSSRSR